MSWSVLFRLVPELDNGRTFVRSFVKKLPCDLHVPSPADPMRTQSPTFKDDVEFDPTFVTLATPSFPPTATGVFEADELPYSCVVMGGLRGYTPSTWLMSAGLMGEAMN